MTVSETLRAVMTCLVPAFKKTLAAISDWQSVIKMKSSFVPRTTASKSSPKRYWACHYLSSNTSASPRWKKLSISSSVIPAILFSTRIYSAVAVWPDKWIADGHDLRTFKKLSNVECTLSTVTYTSDTLFLTDWYYRSWFKLQLGLENKKLRVNPTLLALSCPSNLCTSAVIYF